MNGQEIHLSPGEKEVLQLMCDGLSNKEIAARRGVCLRTVETQRERLYVKIMGETGSFNGIQIYNRAVALGLVECPCRRSLDCQI